MPRFVILDHDHPTHHWDFLIEAGDILRAWRLLAEPVRGQSVPAASLPDHRLVYLDYEGPISGDRGRVVRSDWGTFDWIEDGVDRLRLRSAGRRIVGEVTLSRSNSGWTFEWF